MSGGAAAPRRYLLCTTPAQGHTAPLVALARRLVNDGHAVTFFTTAHYREQVEATGAAFAPFGRSTTPTISWWSIPSASPLPSAACAA